MECLLPIIVEDVTLQRRSAPPLLELSVALLTGGFDRPYAYGLVMALIAKGVRLDVIGSDQVDSPEMHTTPGLRFFNLWPPQSVNRSAVAKLSRVVKHYASLIQYTAVAEPRIFHILWNSKIQLFDRTLLMLYYKAMGKKVALTAHNVNQGRRDGNDSVLNRLTLRMQYALTDHIFVHTQKMKNELIAEFGVRECAVTVIRHPINDAFPDTELTPVDAKRKLGLRSSEKTILCFGRIKPYKGIEHLLSAFQQLAKNDPDYRLIIAGEVQKGNEQYMADLKQTIRLDLERGKVILKAQFIPDAEMEIYLKAADVMVLPYNEIFQSGVLFLSYTFGLPVIATDVGSFREEIVEGKTGFLCQPGDPPALANTIDKYFASDLYRNLGARRLEIRNYADVHHSWGSVAVSTRNAYARMLGRRPS
jgi:glycosyltransferase involved in cell wall biosynthesis